MAKNEQFLWVEKYRPHKIEDCILPKRLKDVFLQYVKEGSIPNLLLTGSPGTGKTTVARALCEEIGLDYIFINSSDERGIDTLRMKIKNYASTVSMTGGRKVIIMDEADYITPEAQAALRGAMEQFSNNCTFILTCNFKSKLIDAIHSRCTVVDFKLERTERPEMAAAFMHRLEMIMLTHKIEFEMDVLARIVQTFFPDFRRTLNEIQRLSKQGPIDSNVLNQLQAVKRLDELFTFLKEKDFKGMRKWVVDNSDADMPTLFKAIWTASQTMMKPTSIPQAVLILAKYQYQGAFVADQELNLTAALTELMVDCEYL